MTLKADKLADLRTKHLEMVQAVVARMASQGAAAKAACITLVTAIAGFAVTLQKPEVICVALVPIIMFTFINAQVLRLERHFRHEFDRIRKANWSKRTDFAITTVRMKSGFRQALFSWSVFGFYGPLLLAAVAVWIVPRFLHGG